MSLTPSQARRAIRVSLLNLVDRPLNPEEKQRIRSRFNNQCAYCGHHLEERKAHFDHIIPISNKEKGSNHINNFVAACNVCNGDLKRDLGWKEFLDLLVKLEKISPADALSRKVEIEKWMNESIENSDPINPALKDLARHKADEIIAAYSAAVETIRKALENA